MRATFLLFLLLACFVAAKPLSAADAPKPVPYLGPGIDKLGKEEYERIYKNYIQATLLLGYPLLRGPAAPCEQALSAIFRQAGLHTYPVPGDAAQVVRHTASVGGKKLEVYILGGMLVQLVRNAAGVPERLFWLNSSSPMASRRLVTAARKEVLNLEKDPVTNLERVKGLPVGFPHQLLGSEGQGLFVRVLRFNGSKDSCEPLEFFDNAWSGGFDLSDQRCSELSGDAARVWDGALTTEAFYQRELQRSKDRAVAAARARGLKEDEARALANKHFVPPFTAEINVVGAAMRSLAQCNLVALGRGGPKRPAGADGASGGAGTGMDTGKGAGSAQ